MRYLYQWDTCISEIPVSVRYLYQWGTCISDIPVSVRYLYQWGTCISEVPVSVRYLYQLPWGQFSLSSSLSCVSLEPPHYVRFLIPWRTAPSRPGPPHYQDFTVTIRHTTAGRTPLDEGSNHRRDPYLTTHNSHKRKIAMPLTGFELAIPASERPQTHALDCTVMRIWQHNNIIWRISGLQWDGIDCLV
jgi:hypothetical protein